jgi:hypothetical protein
VRAVQQRGLDDCARASVASILERDYEDVPDFAVEAAELGQWWGWRISKWLKSEGYPFRFEVWNCIADATPFHPGWWLGVTVAKGRDCNHLIVCRDACIVWDPSLRVGTADYDALPFRFLGIGYFFVPEPSSLKSTP